MSVALSRKALVAIVAIACIVLLLLIAFGILFSSIDAKTAPLSLRVRGADVLLYISTTDQRSFQASFNRLIPQLLSSTDKLESFPMGDRYELAVLERDGKRSWIMYVQQKEEGKHETLVSHNDPSLFLPIRETRDSLGRSALVRGFVGKQDENWSYIRPHVIFTGQDMKRVFLRSLTRESRAMLIIQRTQDAGIMVLEGSRPRVFQSVSSTTPQQSTVLTVSLGEGVGMMDMYGRLLKAENEEVAEGVKGVLQQILKNYTGKTDIRTFSVEMMAGQTELIAQEKEGQLIIAFKGVAKDRHVLEKWKGALLSDSGGTGIREISFSKTEKRVDMKAETKSTHRSIGKSGDWHLWSTAGTGSAKALFFALNENHYVVTTDEASLRLVTEQSTTTKSQQFLGKGGAIMGHIDTEWLARMNKGELNDGFELENFLGKGKAGIMWNATPVNEGWLIQWKLLGEELWQKPPLAK